MSLMDKQCVTNSVRTDRSRKSPWRIAALAGLSVLSGCGNVAPDSAGQPASTSAGGAGGLSNTTEGPQNGGTANGGMTSQGGAAGMASSVAEVILEGGRKQDKAGDEWRQWPQFRLHQDSAAGSG